jgi:hypothetical protein
MATDGRDLLTVLKGELAFLDRGGYRNTARASWRPQFIFQDSPTCLNFDPGRALRPCTECAMLRLVPERSVAQQVPCRFIPISDDGRTVEWYYRHGTQEELEVALRKWLQERIAGLETERAEKLAEQTTPEVHVHRTFAKEV